MKIDCLFIANDPGSVNVLYPVIKEISKTHLQFICYIVDYGKEHLIRESIPFKVFDESYDSTKIRQLLKDSQPSVIVAGQSSPQTFLGQTERRFINESLGLGIFSISIIDFWSNYRSRFSLYRRDVLDALPNLICAIDTSMEKDLLKEDIPKDRIVVTGSPYFDQLKNIKNSITNKKKSVFRTKFGFRDDEIVIIFLSQPIKNDFKRDDLGFDEEVIFKDILDVIECQEWACKARVIWKAHPREENKNLKELYSNNQIAVSEFNKGDIFELMAGSNLIIGAFTMLLVEALLLNFPCISYQPNEKYFLKLPYNIKTLKNYESLKIFFASKEFLKPNNNQFDKLELKQNSSEIIKNLILSHAKQ